MSIDYSTCGDLMQRLRAYTKNETDTHFDLEEQLLLNDLVAVAKLADVELKELLARVRTTWGEIHIHYKNKAN